MRPRVFILLAILAFVPLILSSVATPFPETVRSISTQTFKPLFETTDFFSDSLKGVFTRTRDIFTVYKQNQELRSQISQLKIEISQLKEFENQIARIQKLLPYLDRYPKTVALAKIVFRGLSFWDQDVVINKGTKDGVQKDMPIVTSQGLVGRVISASATTAHIMLLTDYSSKVSVVGQESRDIGLLSGEDSKTLRIMYMDLASTIKVGDTVVTSGMGGIYPKGIPVGKVDTVGKDKDGLHLYALVTPFVDFSKLEEVLCMARTRKELEFSRSS
ncbi:MAG: rod shape-determining protein MreC [Candidatus Omnitrophica bacterium]|nr:rod shape-determining protein MreC [Candidatus Omnitrophota bacterium]